MTTTHWIILLAVVALAAYWFGGNHGYNQGYSQAVAESQAAQ